MRSERTPPYPLWEYNILTLGGVNPYDQYLNNQINTLGLDGWELIGIDGRHLYFKRPFLKVEEPTHRVRPE